MLGDACKLSLVVIGTTVHLVLVLYITNRTLLPEAICCSLQTSKYCCFYQGGKYIYRRTLFKCESLINANCDFFFHNRI